MILNAFLIRVETSLFCKILFFKKTENCLFVFIAYFFISLPYLIISLLGIVAIKKIER